jgi:hypothetical protein
MKSGRDAAAIAPAAAGEAFSGEIKGVDLAFSGEEMRRPAAGWLPGADWWFRSAMLVGDDSGSF